MFPFSSFILTQMKVNFRCNTINVFHKAPPPNGSHVVIETSEEGTTR